ncbi:MAG TPA: MFS transporter [Planctomycetaceae bacterium]|nr:MFS transporter [Planctomycetaceae bacterium]
MTDAAIAESSFAETAWTVSEPLSLPEESSSSRAAQLRRDLRSSLGDAAGSGLMVGTGETYLPAFVLAAGLGQVLSGLITSLPQLAGGIMQLVSPHGVRLLRSHRKWVVTCATFQGLAFVPLALAAWQGGITRWLVLAAAVLYWSAGLASNPPWNTWMGSLIPGCVRPRYFARRNRLQQAAVLTGFLVSGLAIEYGASPQNALAGFGLLFGLAIVGRLGSVACLARTSEPDPLPSNIRSHPWPALARRFTRGAEAQRLLYLSLVQAAAYFAGPYFAPYMLCILKLSYGEYVILISAAYVARVIALPLWGGVAARFGTRRLLWIGGLGIVPSAGAWLISDRFSYLVVVQLLSGAVWAAYELAVFLIGVNSVRAEERTSVLTVFNLATTTGMVAGSILGGAMLIVLGESREVYYLLFAGSSLLRLGSLYFLPRIPARLLERPSLRLRGALPAVLPTSASLIANSSEERPATRIWRAGARLMRQSA